MMSAAARLAVMAVLLAIGRDALAEMPLSQRKSGTETMAPEARAMQADDFANPGMLFVMEGEMLWSRPAGPRSQSCASCHGDAKAAMRGVAARYPAFDAASGGPMDLDGRINQCRTERQGAPAFSREGREILSLSAYVAHQSRGLPIVPPDDARLAAFRQRGAALFQRRVGQLDLSCAMCHDERWGQKLAGNTIPQGHPTGYPTYRLEWQTLGSLHRRLRNCLTGVRAEAPSVGARELVELELYLMWRARGMDVETPSVRP